MVEAVKIHPIVFAIALSCLMWTPIIAFVRSVIVEALQ